MANRATRWHPETASKGRWFVSANHRAHIVHSVEEIFPGGATLKTGPSGVGKVLSERSLRDLTTALTAFHGLRVQDGSLKAQIPLLHPKLRTPVGVQIPVILEPEASSPLNRTFGAVNVSISGTRARIELVPLPARS